jgi:hypothetical protein
MIEGLTVSVDAREFCEAMETLTANAEASPEVWECFSARFPQIQDSMECDAHGLRMKVRPSDALLSFMQDLL